MSIIHMLKKNCRSFLWLASLVGALSLGSTMAYAATGTVVRTLFATDAAGATGPVSITVTSAAVTGYSGGSHLSPIAITFPTDGSSFDTHSSLQIAVSPGSNTGIRLVQFYANGSLLGQAISMPFTYSTKTLNKAGTYIFTAKAFDNTGQSIMSPPVTATLVKTVGHHLDAVLSFGMTSPDVQVLQAFLNAHGFTVTASGPGSPGQESSFFGPATADAVRAFQNAYANEILVPSGLMQATGYVGPATLAKINMIMDSEAQ